MTSEISEEEVVISEVVNELVVLDVLVASRVLMVDEVIVSDVVVVASDVEEVELDDVDASVVDSTGHALHASEASISVPGQQIWIMLASQQTGPRLPAAQYCPMGAHGFSGLAAHACLSTGSQHPMLPFPDAQFEQRSEIAAVAVVVVLVVEDVEVIVEVGVVVEIADVEVEEVEVVEVGEEDVEVVEVELDEDEVEVVLVRAVVVVLVGTLHSEAMGTPVAS